MKESNKKLFAQFLVKQITIRNDSSSSDCFYIEKKSWREKNCKKNYLLRYNLIGCVTERTSDLVGLPDIPSSSTESKDRWGLWWLLCWRWQWYRCNCAGLDSLLLLVIFPCASAFIASSSRCGFLASFYESFKTFKWAQTLSTICTINALDSVLT